jgi:hypothetical protein
LPTKFQNQGASWESWAKTPADDPSSAYVADFLATFESLALVKAFVCIEDPKLRRAIVRLVEEIVPETGSSNED